MKKVIFKCQYFKLRVKDILIIIGILFLLVFGFVACQKQEEGKGADNPQIKEIEDEELSEEEKEELIQEKLNDTCEFTKSNINDFHDLLNRVNLCDDEWFKDLEHFIKRIDEQNKRLKEKTDKYSKDIFIRQQVWGEEIIKLKNEQSDKNIQAVEKVFKEYKKHYEKTCIKGTVGE